MPTEMPIDNWGIYQLFSQAYKKGSWIECIALGYTILEIALTYLLKSKASPTGIPLPQKTIDKEQFLSKKAILAKDKGFIGNDLLDEILKFNSSRNKVIHKLASGTVKASEIEDAAKCIMTINSKIQTLWLPITVGETIEIKR